MEGKPNQVKPIRDSGRQKIIPGRKNELMIVADAKFFQAVVVNKRSELKNVIIYKCGETVLYAHGLNSFFDGSRKEAPEWLVEQLNAISPAKHMTEDGVPYTSISAGQSVPVVPLNAPADSFDLDDEDAPGVSQG